MNPSDPRKEIVEQVITFFEQQALVKHAFLRGSLASEGGDQFSDIDIGVDVSGWDNGQFLLQVPALLATTFPMAFHDWVPSLLPDAYVVNIYLRDLPLFWNIDIQCLATPHVPSLKTVSCDPADHFLKLWILNAKYYLRGNVEAKQSIRKLAQRILPGQNIGSQDAPELMGEILHTLKNMQSGKQAETLRKCEELCKQLRTNSFRR